MGEHLSPLLSLRLLDYPRALDKPPPLALECEVSAFSLPLLPFTGLDGVQRDKPREDWPLEALYLQAVTGNLSTWLLPSHHSKALTQSQRAPSFRERKNSQNKDFASDVTEARGFVLSSKRCSERVTWEGESPKLACHSVVGIEVQSRPHRSSREAEIQGSTLSTKD